MFFGLFSTGDDMIDKLIYMGLSIAVIFIIIFFFITPLAHISSRWI